MNDTTDWASESEFDDSSVDTFELWGMLWRRKWIVVAAVTLSVVLGFLYYYNAQPYY